jgi:hypothetical protein
MFNNQGMARAGAAMAACGTAALLALTGCASGGPSSSATGGTTAAGDASPSAAALRFRSGPAHTISTPATLDGYSQSSSLERAMNVDQLRSAVIQGSSGQVSGVKDAVYTRGSVTPGASGDQQVFMFVGGHLTNQDPAFSIASFEQAYPSAKVIPAGSLGGQAACASTTVSNQSVATCVWFDNDSFGTLVSPTMSTAKLANTLDTVRPGLEQVVQ